MTTTRRPPPPAPTAIPTPSATVAATDRQPPRVTVSARSLVPGRRGGRRVDRAGPVLGGLHREGGRDRVQIRRAQPEAARHHGGRNRNRADQGATSTYAFVRFNSRVRARLFRRSRTVLTLEGRRHGSGRQHPARDRATGTGTRVNARSFCKLRRQGSGGAQRGGRWICLEGNGGACVRRGNAVCAGRCGDGVGQSSAVSARDRESAARRHGPRPDFPLLRSTNRRRASFAAPDAPPLCRRPATTSSWSGS